MAQQVDVSLEELRTEAERPHARVRLAYALLGAGLTSAMAALVVGIALGVISGDYWSTAKASRDGAAAGSDLLAQIGSVSAVSTWLEPFKFVGVALFFSGIVTALASIVPRIRLRAAALATVLPIATQHKAGS
ncbi:MAG: hypothetical protein IIC94_07350 [Chloroflexi bacterium]|nr:hypothetical protein [Chloroflexota bacterium]